MKHQKVSSDFPWRKQGVHAHNFVATTNNQHTRSSLLHQALRSYVNENMMAFVLILGPFNEHDCITENAESL